MSDFVDSIRKAVAALSAASDADWTQAGLPDVARVRELAADPSITRPDIEAACPKATRVTAAETQDDEPQGEPPEGVPTSETDETPPETEDQSSEEEETDAAMSIGEFFIRGLLMAIIMRLPQAMRILADRAMLDDMLEFVLQFGMDEERQVVVEMIRAISETKQGEIPSGQYKQRVLAAMDVVRGELDDTRTGIVPADDNDAAAARLARVTGSGPAPGHSLPSALTASQPADNSGATPEQLEAHARLYGGGDPTDGVRSADE